MTLRGSAMNISTQLIAAMITLSSITLPAQAIDKLPVTLTISGPQTIPAGKIIEIDAVLTNVTKKTITFWWGYLYTLQIHDEHGKVPPLKPGLWLNGGGSTGPHAIEPGETFGEPIGGLLSKYDLSVPGVYVVRVTYPLVIVDGDFPRQHVVQSGILESNEITIKVVAKDSDTP